MDKISNDARVYTDVQGLDKLRAEYKSNPDAVKKEVSQQFEALLFQMVLRSMRDANSAFSSDLFSSNDMSLYQDMFDKQLSLSLSSQGTGFAKMIEDNIDQQNGVNKAANPLLATQKMLYEPKKQPISMATVQSTLASHVKTPNKVEAAHALEETNDARESPFKSPSDFIHSLWGHAKQAAKLIGVNPTVLLAQAALETDWGKKVISHTSGQSTHNLFNIKTDPTWKKDSTITATLEQKGGILVKEKATFKSYESYHESFMDYAKLIKSSSRYRKAVENAQEPASYMQALQEAGYATDSQYSNKVIEILHGPQFQPLVTREK